MLNLTLLVVASLTLGNVLCGPGWFPVSSGSLPIFPAKGVEGPVNPEVQIKPDDVNLDDRSLGTVNKGQPDMLKDTTGLTSKMDEKSTFIVCCDTIFQLLAIVVELLKRYSPEFQLISVLYSLIANLLIFIQG